MMFLGSRMYFQFEPGSTRTTPGRFTLVNPKVVDVGIFSVAMASNHTESIHGIYNVGLCFGSFSSDPHFHEKGIIISLFLLCQFPFFYTSCMLKRISHQFFLLSNTTCGEATR